MGYGSLLSLKDLRKKNTFSPSLRSVWLHPSNLPIDHVLFNLQKSGADMPYVPGHEEDGFLKKLDISAADIEPKADGCTKIYVW